MFSTKADSLKNFPGKCPICPCLRAYISEGANKGPSLRRSSVFYTEPEAETDDPTPPGARKE